MKIQDVKIVSEGQTAHVFIDGEDISDKLVGYSIEHKAVGICRVTLRYCQANIEYTGKAAVKHIDCNGNEIEP